MATMHVCDQAHEGFETAIARVYAFKQRTKDGSVYDRVGSRDTCIAHLSETVNTVFMLHRKDTLVTEIRIEQYRNGKEA